MAFKLSFCNLPCGSILRRNPLNPTFTGTAEMATLGDNSLTPTVEYPDPVRHEWRMMAELRLRMPDIAVKEIAKALGYASHTVRAWSRNPAYQRYENFVIKKQLDELPPSSLPGKTVAQVFSEYEVEMAERLIDICQTSSDEKLSAQIAQDLLDRAGHAPKHRENVRPLIINLGNDVLQMFQRRALEAGLVAIDGHTLEESTR